MMDISSITFSIGTDVGFVAAFVCDLPGTPCMGGGGPGIVPSYPVDDAGGANVW